jgi:4-diphosphocytidyl-2-C-methyl-D-erythritol kinase
MVARSPLLCRTPHFASGRNSLVVAAPAKLNLFLEVRGKRPDGFHDLESLMVAVNLFDTLELTARTDGVLNLTCDQPDLSTGPENLVYKAAEKLRGSRTGLGASIHLVKRIPMQAGLAGGSSDAAAAIIALNHLWQLNLSDAELAAVAAEVGSDVAFFLALPAAWCTGRGEIVAPEPSARSYFVVLVCPPFGVPTAAVFRSLQLSTDACVDGSAARTAFRTGDPVALGAALFNRLQPAAIHLAPVVETVYRRLAGLNPAGCLMSGSGSAVFAVCRDSVEANRVANALRATRPPAEPESRVMVVRTIHIERAASPA